MLFQADDLLVTTRFVTELTAIVDPTPASDLINSTTYLADGEYGQASISLAGAAVPFGLDKGGKLLGKAAVRFGKPAVQLMANLGGPFGKNLFRQALTHGDEALEGVAFLAKYEDEVAKAASKVDNLAPNRAVNALDDVGAMSSRLQRLGYDQANTARIMRAIENGEQVVIVGENMKRVNAVARMVEKAGGRSVTYAPRNWTGVSRNSLEANRSWIRYWAKDKGVTVIDIGRQSTPRPFGPSPFYGIENRSLNRWGIYTPFSD